MKKIFATAIILFAFRVIIFGQCEANYTYFDSSDSITFQNLTSGANNHFYWNFGDGSGSTDENPLHVFPDDGEYLVTLYVHDTLTNCSDYVENWITVDKIDTFACQLFLYYELYDCGVDSCLLTTDLSNNCSDYSIDCDAAQAMNAAWDISLGDGWKSTLFLVRLQAYSNIEPIGTKIEKEYYKTFPNQFDRSLNYQSCSANFEIHTEYRDTGALVTFTAMNKSATSYEWIVTGFGQPIFYYTPVAAHFYPYIDFEKYVPWMVNLRLYDANNNCGDTVRQQILIKTPNYGYWWGIDEHSSLKRDLQLYPNPSNGNFTLEFDALQSADEIIYITDALGSTVKSYQFDINSGKNSLEINLESLADGIYYLRLGEEVMKVFKE